MTRMTKLRFLSVLLIAALSAYVFLAGGVLVALGMNDGGGL
jgi:hypothetical protein